MDELGKMNVNVVRYMNEFRNVLSYATNIGFFFGAGTSCAFGLPNIVRLTDNVKKSLSQQGECILLFENAEKCVKDLSKKSQITIEDVLNHVREIRDLTNGRENYEFNGITGAQASELDKAICSAIFEDIRNAMKNVNLLELRRFFAWYEAVNRDFIKEIYTTNYDMLLEMAMEANRVPYFDGFTGSYEPFFSSESVDSFPNENDSTSKWIRLWKIHGSLNWMKKSVTDYSEERIIRVANIDCPDNELMIYPSREKYNLSRREPYIAYFDRLKKYLNRGNLVFIVSGYSFGDEHINEFIFNALKSNSRLYVIVLCYNDNQVEYMEKYASSCINLCVMGPEKVIVNGVMKIWTYDNSEDKDIGAGMYWQDDKFILGDFKSLINFLIENSGRKNIIEEIANAK